MGSNIEINDTLQITNEQGFPAELNYEKYIKNPKQVSLSVINRIYNFTREDIRIFHSAPTRVFLVQNIEGKWLHWGHALILEQTIHAQEKITSGKFQIIKIYSPEYQQLVTINESPEGKAFEGF